MVTRFTRWWDALWREDKDAFWGALAIWIPLALYVIFGGAR